MFSSDHAPFRYDGARRQEAGRRRGRRSATSRTAFPGIETRLPLLYSEGVLGGRITLQQFVELTATNPAKAYGLHPRKGTIAVGADADLVIWDERELVLRNAQLHHAVDYTPYEGMTLRAWPALTMARGEVVWDGASSTPAPAAAASCACGAPTLLPRRS